MRGRGGFSRMMPVCNDNTVASSYDAELASTLVQKQHKQHYHHLQRPKHTERGEPMYDGYVVLDFEATCEGGQRIADPEIIEFPMILIDARTGCVLAEFQRYVRPVLHPTLSTFCTELTGITQSVVDAAETFPAVWKAALDFLHRAGYGGAPPLRSYLFVTCGDWDLQTMLPRQLEITARYHDEHTSSTPVTPPATFKRWCNIKKLMRSHCGFLHAQRRISDLPDMMAVLGLHMKGRHHSGIDDCRNIVSVLQRLMCDGCCIAPTTDHSGLQQWMGSLSNVSAPITSLVSDKEPSSSSLLLLSSEQQQQQQQEEKEKEKREEMVADTKRTSEEEKDVKERKRQKDRLQSKPLVKERMHVNILTDVDPLPTLLQGCTLSESEKITYSKALSRILRHAADSMGIPISNEGYVRVEDLIKKKPFCNNPQAVKHIAFVVHTNEKQRFKMAYDEDHHLYIRANQGHSMDGINPELQRITSSVALPDTIVHGTYHNAWKEIRACGYLSTMSRQHIHFAKGLSKSDGVISGMRGNVQVLLYLDVDKLLADGIELWESANGVVLTPGVGQTKRLPLVYIARVVDRETGENLPF
ncbi:phosphotransferase [Trypanosoma theileri]|uniref:2'-phosphotransferase n=1 Tax=Trypanosoma theileri TaxID=67003 RepID=A0A1X0NVN6_9TRYP|nr:phosphotransferase [Trypanosoma theileri]ORC88755.1 phosphotransferase [Trypanosoma theileri]